MLVATIKVGSKSVKIVFQSNECKNGNIKSSKAIKKKDNNKGFFLPLVSKINPTKNYQNNIKELYVMPISAI